MNAITYRMMDSTDDMRQVEELQRVVWGMSTVDILSATTMRWIVHIGGLLIGAWDNDKLVGFSIGSVGKREGKWVFWSDMAGIHPDYQSQGIGYQLKLMQRIWACEQGYEEIRWTFDPMRRGNASFNFCKLGVISYLYHPSFYGVMQDNINKGLQADRLEVVWLTEVQQQRPSILPNAPFVVEFAGDTVQIQDSEAQQVRIQIPYYLDALKSDNLPLAMDWQQMVREAFMKYFKLGYQAVNFVKEQSGCWYILHKK